MIAKTGKQTCNKKSCPCKKGTKSTAKSSCRAKKMIAKVQAEINIGWGNTLFIRGQGGNLNWDKGIPMVNTQENIWTWETNTQDTIEFKVLLNDEQWSEGDNYILKPSQVIKVKPTFTKQV